MVATSPDGCCTAGYSKPTDSLCIIQKGSFANLKMDSGYINRLSVCWEFDLSFYVLFTHHINVLQYAIQCTASSLDAANNMIKIYGFLICGLLLHLSL